MVNYVKDNKLLKILIIVLIPVIIPLFITYIDISLNLGRFIGSLARNISILYQ